MMAPIGRLILLRTVKRKNLMPVTALSRMDALLQIPMLANLAQLNAASA